MSAPARVVGLDLSLRSTGLSDGRTHLALKTTPASATEDRLNYLMINVRMFVRHDTDLVVLEGSSYGSKGPGHEELAALRWMARCWLYRWGIPFAVVAPRQLKQFLTGNGAASKQDVVEAADKAFGTSFLSDTKASGREDKADALALAAMGYQRLGASLGRVSRPNVVEGISWPEMLCDA
jgi:Holliday junction resolvasome RuvABC endonuclease subunit